MRQGRPRHSFGRPSPAMIVAVIALIVALGGTAIAAKKFQLPKNSVGSRQIKRKAVTTGKLANNAINGQKVAANSLTGADINLGALGTVPSATDAAHAGNADTVTGHAAACPSGTTLIRGVCYDSTSSGPAPDLKSAADACAAKGGYLPGPMQLFSVRGVINLGTGVGTDHQFTDSVHANTSGGNYSTITVDGTGALAEQLISNPSKYICAYPLVR